jgi:DNA invertase Pin-like site-specific DNA recombinase
MKMVFGYIRQNNQSELQKEEIKTYYSENFSNLSIKFFEERRSYIKNDPSQFEQLKKELREGDILIIYNLKQLAENSRQLIHIIDELIQKKIILYTLQEKINTSIESGVFLFNWFEILKKFDNNIVQTDRGNILQQKGVDFHQNLEEKVNALENRFSVLEKNENQRKQMRRIKPKSEFYSTVIFDKKKDRKTFHLHVSLINCIDEYVKSFNITSSDLFTKALIDYMEQFSSQEFLTKITPEYLTSIHQRIEVQKKQG